MSQANPANEFSRVILISIQEAQNTLIQVPRFKRQRIYQLSTSNMEIMQANSGSSTESHRYYICSDLIDLDDNQEEQVSLYKTSVESSTYLTPAEALAYAEKQGAENWSILAFGGGDSKRIDKHHIEYSGIVDGVQNSWVIEEFDSSNSIAINS